MTLSPVTSTFTHEVQVRLSAREWRALMRIIHAGHSLLDDDEKMNVHQDMLGIKDANMAAHKVTYERQRVPVTERRKPIMRDL